MKKVNFAAKKAGKLNNHQLPTIAVGIPTYRREQVLVDTIEQVLRQQYPPDEVIVVDQTPEHTPAVENYLSQRHAGHCIEWVRTPTPNLCAARNLILANTECEIVLYLDDDVIIPSDLIKCHRRSYIDDPELDALGGQVYHRNRGVLEVSPSNPKEGTHPIRDIDHRVEDQYYIGCHYSVRRDAAIKVGGFDELFIGSAYWEEGDFAARLVRAGYKLCFDPFIWVTHLQSPAGGCRIPKNNFHPQWSKTCNWFLYQFRYGKTGKGSWRKAIWQSLRAGPLLRENFLRPWKWHYYWYHYLVSILEGRKRGKSKIQSPFVT